MCAFPSWIETKDGNVFLTDKDIEQSNLLNFDDYYCIGHYEIREFHNNIEGESKDGFPCPPDIAEIIMSGKMSCIMKMEGFKQIRLNKDGELHGNEDLPAVVLANGNKYWYKNGKQNRDDDLPAVVLANGDQYWLKDGKKHRDNGPAVLVDGNKYWYKDGELHSKNDLPAVVLANGDQYWYKNGKQNRDNDLPAVVYPNGAKAWLKDGKQHRDNGPAIVFSDGVERWYRNGKRTMELEPWSQMTSEK